MKKLLRIKILSLLLVLAMVLPVTTVSVSAELPPTANLYITGFVGAEINVTDLDGSNLLTVKQPGYYSKYLAPGTEVIISWTVNQDILYYVQVDGQQLSMSETTLRTTIPSQGEVYDFELVKVDSSFDENDDDKDALQNWMEDKLGTDKNKADTDGDNLTDYDELFITLTDPTKKDTDDNGITDGDEDFDADSLSNAIEVKNSGNPRNLDTDSDGLSDSKEFELKTKLDNSDSDEDGLPDGLELKYGMNPLNPDTLGDGIKDGKRKFNVTFDNDEAFDEYGIRPTIEMELDGTQIETLSINMVPDNDPFLSKEVPGFLGNAFDFNVEGDFTKAKMTFEFPLNLLNNPEFEPSIYYFDEDTQLLVELENQVLDGNKISVTVEHFSRYMFINKKIYDKVWEYEFKFDEDSTETFENVDIAFVIDSSGSMTSNDKTGIRKTVTSNFVDKLTDKDSACIIDFDSTAKLLSPFTSDKTTLKAAVNRIDSSGGTTLTTGISVAINQFTDAGYVNDNALKVIIMLTDGDGSYDTSLTKKAADNNIIIYTVGLGSSVSTSVLKAMAEGTTGNYYHASDASKLYHIFDKIAEESDFGKDSDTDSINDYFEKEMNAGRLRLGSGVSLLGMDFQNPDSDNDELYDGEEITVVKTGEKIYVKLLSNPTLDDTDGDEIGDSEEQDIGTNRLNSDTDEDGLADGLEVAIWYDPLDKNPDGDKRLDKQEYNDGTDPYLYDKEWGEHLLDFCSGFVAGDFISDTDSVPTMIGQISSSFIPFVDARDVVGNLVHGDFAFASLSLVGLVPIAGDAGKAAGKIGKFLVKNVDDMPKIVNVLTFVNKNIPDVAKLLGKNDDFLEAAKKLSSGKNLRITRENADVLNETFKLAGVTEYLVKTSDDLPINRIVNVGEGTWGRKPLERGTIIDELLNQHTTSVGLGRTFPTFDRLENMTLISTKSLDIGAQGYQSAATLRRTLNKYLDAMKNFEAKRFGSADVFKCGDTTVYKNSYNKKVLEIVLPDIAITEQSLSVLREILETAKKDGIDIWFVLGK